MSATPHLSCNAVLVHPHGPRKNVTPLRLEGNEANPPVFQKYMQNFFLFPIYKPRVQIAIQLC